MCGGACVVEFVCMEASGLNIFALHKGCFHSLLMRGALEEIGETFLEFTCVHTCWENNCFLIDSSGQGSFALVLLLHVALLTCIECYFMLHKDPKKGTNALLCICSVLL